MCICTKGQQIRRDLNQSSVSHNLVMNWLDRCLEEANNAAKNAANDLRKDISTASWPQKTQRRWAGAGFGNMWAMNRQKPCYFEQLVSSKRQKGALTCHRPTTSRPGRQRKSWTCRTGHQPWRAMPRWCKAPPQLRVGKRAADKAVEAWVCVPAVFRSNPRTQANACTCTARPARCCTAGPQPVLRAKCSAFSRHTHCGCAAAAAGVIREGAKSKSIS